MIEDLLLDIADSLRIIANAMVVQQTPGIAADVPEPVVSKPPVRDHAPNVVDFKPKPVEMPVPVLTVPAQVETVETVKTETAPEVTREMVGKKLILLATTKGRDVAVDVLARFKAGKLADIAVAQYVEVNAALDEALA